MCAQYQKKSFAVGVFQKRTAPEEAFQVDPPLEASADLY